MPSLLFEIRSYLLYSMALNYSYSDLCLLNKWNYRHVPPCWALPVPNSMYVCIVAPESIRFLLFNPREQLQHGGTQTFLNNSKFKTLRYNSAFEVIWYNLAWLASDSTFSIAQTSDLCLYRWVVVLMQSISYTGQCLFSWSWGAIAFVVKLIKLFSISKSQRNGPKPRFCRVLRIVLWKLPNLIIPRLQKQLKMGKSLFSGKRMGCSRNIECSIE